LRLNGSASGVDIVLNGFAWSFKEIDMRNTPSIPSIRISTLAASVALVAGLTACASPPMSSDRYPMGNPPPTSAYPSSGYPAAGAPYGANNPNYTEYGRVTGIEAVRTEEQGRSTGAGAVLGGVAGGVVGNQIGGGSGRDVARIAGIVGGALAGNAIERNRNSGVREVYRVSIRTDNGAQRYYDVPNPGDLRVGDRVRLENNQINRM
jgi:outer membrane lipoprotein SlyB